MLHKISDIFRDINKYFFNSLGDVQCASEVSRVLHSDDQRFGRLINDAVLTENSEGFLVFVIHDNYLLQWVYTDIWCVLHLKYNILVISSSIHVQMVWRPSCFSGNSPYRIAVMFTPAGRSGKTTSLPSFILLTMCFNFFIYSLK